MLEPVASLESWLSRFVVGVVVELLGFSWLKPLGFVIEVQTFCGWSCLAVVFGIRTHRRIMMGKHLKTKYAQTESKHACCIIHVQY